MTQQDPTPQPKPGYRAATDDPAACHSRSATAAISLAASGSGSHPAGCR